MESQLIQIIIQYKALLLDAEKEMDYESCIVYRDALEEAEEQLSLIRTQVKYITICQTQ